MKHRLLLFAVALVAVVGCQRPAKEEGPGAAKEDGAKLKIVYIPKNTGNPYFNDAIKGFEEACEELGCEVFSTAPATGEATSQIPLSKELIQRGVDVIAVAANHPDAVNAVLDEAKEKGILVITVEADLVGNESHRVAAVMPTDFSQIGSSQVA